jgi:RNA polymerase sigma-70 factor, ECF subfamily
MDYTEAQLVSQYLKERQEQFLEILFSRHLRAVHAFVLRYVGDQAVAEDITQEVFVKAWKNLKKFDLQKNFKTWLFSIARNTCIDYLRKKRTLVFSDFENDNQNNALTDTLIDPEPLPLEILQNRDFLAEFELALQKLPLASRVVILMHLNEDLAFKDIAETLKQPLDTIKSRYRRGLLAIRKAWEQKKA